MKERLTRPLDEFPCRANNCIAEEWMEMVTETSVYSWSQYICDFCPFEKYINKLAEYEDKEEKMEDDLK